uniref:BglG family transcription antiterminator n=1 Tax=Paenibacillus doosanensis TaxID=1229154 RepID=UPI00287B75F5|nr:BglG family transcription antiterminator [Paenibacillus doosanensis]
MLNVSSRHRQILELLLNRKDEITAGEIAAAINVSTRTVHRELSEVEQIVEAYGLKLHKKSGIGIQIYADDPERLESFRERLSRTSAVDFSAEDRKVWILCSLLEAQEPVKLFTLAHDMKVTMPTVAHDLDELESWIGKRGLQLVRRRGYGVEINGSETSKQKAIGYLAGEHLDDSDLFGPTGRTVRPATAKLLNMVGKPFLMEIENALWEWGRLRNADLAEVAYTELLVRLSTAVKRIEQGTRMKSRKRGGSHAPGEVPEFARPIVASLSARLGIEFTEEETAYIAELLREATLGPAGAVNGLLPQDDLSLIDKMNRLIRYAEARTGVSVTEDRTLREGLLTHLESALDRLRHGAYIRNPLLAQIKKDYDYLFGILREGVDSVITDVAVPDEEVGFLVMHFGAALERLNQFRRNVRAILVCTSGIGSSKMLAIRIGKQFPQIEIVGNVSWYEAARQPGEAYDLIISTVDLPLEADQYIKLSPLLTKEEAERLRRFIQDITLKKNPSAKRQAADEGQGAWERLLKLKAYLDEIVRLIGQFRVHLAGGPSASLRDVVLELCAYVKEAGVLDQAGPVADQLVEREKLGSQLIPDTSVALFHTRSEYVRRPSLTLFRLSESIVLEAEGPTEVRHILLMLGPRELAKESLEVLSEISALLLVPEMIGLLERGEPEEIKRFLSEELARFFIDKTQ